MIFTLQKEVKDLKSDVVTLGKEKEKVQASLDQVVEKAVTIAKLEFRNVVNQIQIVHPDLEIDCKVVHHDHVVKDDKIIRLADVEEDETIT